MKERAPEITLFEGAATSDPIPVERYTGSLKRTIEFFGTRELGRFRFVTKYTEVDSLLNADHRGHTRFRFSINTQRVIKKHEHGTPGMDERLEAASKVAASGYPLGFIIAPIMIYPGWEDQYRDLIINLKKHLGPAAENNVTFELISHRFTSRAKKRLLEIFPPPHFPWMRGKENISTVSSGMESTFIRRKHFRKWIHCSAGNWKEIFRHHGWGTWCRWFTHFII